MRRPALTVTLFVSLLLFWFALSGRFDPLFVAMGVVSAAVVTLITRDLVADTLGSSPVRGRLLPRIGRAVAYGVWLVGRIVVASAQLAVLVLDPRLPLDPALLRFRTTLRHPVARVMLANTITLIPGTMTLRLTDDEYLVHALTPAAAADLVTGRMQTMIGALFLEGPERDPHVTWERGPRS